MRITEVTLMVWNEEKFKYEEHGKFVFGEHDSFATLRCPVDITGLAVDDVGFWQFSDHNEMTVWLARCKMKDKPLYEFLFPVVSGGDARVIVCRVETPTGECPKVVRTRIGMIRHLKGVHHIELQLPLFGGPDPVLK